MARKNEAGYAPPSLPQRPFEHDYRRAPQGDAGSILKADIEGRPLVAPIVAGRRTLGGGDEGLTPDAILEVARRLGSVTEVPRGELPKRAVGTFDPKTNAIRIAKGLDPEDTRIAVAHEGGHAIAENARLPVSLDGSAIASRKVYHDLSTGSANEHRVGKFMSPEIFGYPPSQVGQELRAELMRAYMMDPNYLKTTAPKAAAAIRASVNADPWLSKIVQFNAAPPILIGATAAASGALRWPDESVHGDIE